MRRRPLFDASRQVFYGDEPAANLEILSGAGDEAVTDNNGRFELPYREMWWGETSAVSIQQNGPPLEFVAGSALFVIPADGSDFDIVIELPELIELDVRIETDCGDNVPLGQCPLVPGTSDVWSLGFLTDLTTDLTFALITDDPQKQGLFVFLNVVTDGEGPITVFADMQGYSFDVGINGQFFEAVWDGSSPFIIRETDPSTTTATYDPVASATPVCIEDPLVQDDPAAADLGDGDVFVSSTNGINYLIDAGGPGCTFGCYDGFDMNCDGKLGDYCPIEINRHTVKAVTTCRETTTN